MEVQRAFYEAPPEYIGRQVWVRLPLAFASRYQSLRGGDRNSPTLSFREGNFFMADRDVNWRAQKRRLLGLIALLAREFAPIDCLPPRHRAL